MTNEHNMDMNVQSASQPATANPVSAATQYTDIQAAIGQSMQQITQLREQMSRAVVGQQQVIDELLVCLLSSGHALIEGVPGLGKTLMVRALSKSVGGNFGRVQFTPDMMPSDVIGHAMYDMKSQNWRVRKGPVFCNLLLADEINRAPAKTQSALLEVMQEQQVTIEGSSFVLDKPFLTIATQNPIEQEGTYPLPEAQLDRFLLNITIEYPSAQEELAMVKLVTKGQVGDQLNIDQVQQVMTLETLLKLQQLVAQVHMDDAIVDYAVRIARATREWSGIDVGAGPRGSISLLRAARAVALLSGSHFVTPDHVKRIAPAVLRHRIRLSADYEIEGYSKNDVIQGLLENIVAPRQ